MISVRTFTSLAALPPDALALLAADGPNAMFSGPAWFRTVLAHAMPPGATPLFLTACRNDRTIALLALRAQGRSLASLTTPYSCAFAPLLADDLGQTERIAACSALARGCAAWPALRLDALDPEDPRVADLIAGARQAGLVVRQFDHFGNWHEHVAGLSWADYLAQRPGQVRSTVRRKTAAAARRDAAMTILRDTDGLETGITAYEDVYARSWKLREPFPSFNAEIIRAFAPLGQLRLGLMRLNGQVVAAQIWLVARGVATVVKLAHDETFKMDSPGTVLTAHMLRHLLDEEHVQEIDFGRGDDPYKRHWAKQRRQKIGLLLINPRHPSGLVGLIRHELGRATRRIYRRRKSDNAG